MNNVLKLDDNDKLSLLKGIELQDVIVFIENFKLEYRDKINLPSSFTFGTEIEYEYLKKNILQECIVEYLSQIYLLFPEPS